MIIACSPPLTIGLAAWAMSVVKHCKYIYNVQELYPDIAVNLGKMKGRMVIRFFQGVERFIYRHAAFVTSITEGMCAKIRKRTRLEKVVMIPNYVDVDEGSKLKVEGRKLKVVGDGKGERTLTVCYAGNMGVPQNLGVMVEAARILKEKGEKVRFVFAGGGQDEERLKKMAEGLDNVEFRGYLPISEMPRIYAESDVFYVGQDPQAANDGIPSKIYRILGRRKPLLVVTAAGSDLERFVSDSQGGIVVKDADDMATRIRGLMQQGNLVRQMGEAGFAYVKNNYSRSKITGEYAKLVDRVVVRGEKARK